MKKIKMEGDQKTLWKRKRNALSTIVYYERGLVCKLHKRQSVRKKQMTFYEKVNYNLSQWRTGPPAYRPVAGGPPQNHAKRAPFC